jgi:hypothetical protein
MADEIYTVKGTVVSRSSGVGIGGLRVEAWDKDRRIDDLLGIGSTDDAGTFLIRFDQRFYQEICLDRRPDIYFRVFRGQELVCSTEDAVLWNVEQATIDITIPVDIAPNEGVQEGERLGVVKGTVRYANGRPFANGFVRAADVDLRREEPLGERPTDAAGRYVVRYRNAQFRRAEKERADLRVRAFDAKGDQVATSTIVFNAGVEENIDLVVGDEIYRGPSEYEQLVAELTPLLQGLTFAELRQDDADNGRDKHQDVTFLSGETGQDPERIALLILAHRLLDETEVAAEVFYGMFRQGLPTRLPALLMQSPEVQRRALVRSAEANIIPPAFANEANAVLQRFKTLVVRQAMQQPSASDDGTATLNDLLDVALPDTQLREDFLRAYVNHAGPVEAFWQGLAARPEFENHIEDVQRTLQLGAITGNHPPLVRELQRLQQDGEIATLADLTRFDAADWLELLVKDSGNGPIGTPPGTPGKDNAEKAYNYVKAMSHLLEDAFPTTFIANRLEKDDLTGRDDLVSFFNGNADFDVRSTRLTTFLETHPEALAHVQDPEGTKRRIQALQRIYRLAPRYEQASALLIGGVDSAHAVTRMGENVFLATYGDAVGGKAQATRIYAKAQQVEAMALNMVVEYGLATSKTSMPTAPDEAVVEVPGVPEWSTLFGSLELCACEHCQSVYSPAAYLVDMLHFLNDRPSQVANSKAKDILFQRRPGIGEIELTCENTNTPLPCVDLVNEILENTVAPFPTFAPFNLPATVEAALNSRILSQELRNAFIPRLSAEASITAGSAGKPWDVDPDWWTIDESAFTYTIRKENNQLRVVARSLQTKGSAAERAANPQYVNTDAYDALRHAVYPWSLPFDLWAEEARAYLGHLGVPRVRIMESLQPGDRTIILDGVALAREQLGLTGAQADIITGVTTSQAGAANPGPWNLWGFESQNLSAQDSIPDPSDRTRRITGGNWLSVLTGRVDVFLQQSGLTYKELLDVLDTYYVNPVAGNARTVSIVSTDPNNPDTCETDKLRLNGFNQAAAARTVRFLRLWRPLGWSMRDLDRAITAFVPADLDDAFLTRLSHVQRLHTALNIPVLHLLSWWADLDTALYIDHTVPGQLPAASLYEQLWRNRATVNPPDPAFTEAPANLAGTLSDHVAAITAALGISATDFVLLLADANVIPRSRADHTQPDDTLSLDYLSRLYRHASLAKALRLPVRDYLAALNLIATDPFASTTATLIFLETVYKVRDAGFTFAELDYLLRHVFTPESAIAPSDEVIATCLDELRSGLQNIAEENTFRDDPADSVGPTIDLDGDLTRQKLALLDWDGALVDQAVATLNGVVVYEAPLAALPAGTTLPNTTGPYAVNLAVLPAGFAIPNELRDILVYTAAIQGLMATRFLSQSERDLLQAAADAAGDAALSQAVAALFQEQDELQGEISYDAQRQVLRFTGPMTNRRKARLDAVSNDAAYLDAVQALYDAPRRFISRAMRTFAVHDFATDLATLPAAVEFPNALKHKVFFDASATPKRLHCVGVMSEQERDALLALSRNAADPHHAAYQAAVNDLYDQAEALVPAASDAFLSAAGPGADAASLFDTAGTPADRFLLVLEKLLRYLRRTLSEQLAVQKMAEALQLETRTAGTLLRQVLASPVDPQPDPARKRRCLAELLDPAFAESHTNVQLTPTAFPGQFQTFVLAHKAALIIARFTLTYQQLGWLIHHGPSAGWLDLNTLPTDAQHPAAAFASWIRLVDLAQLRDGLPQGDRALDELLARAHAVDAAAAAADKDAAKQAWFAALTRWTGWTPADLETLLGAANDHTQTGLLNLAFPDDYAGERLLVRLHEAFSLLKRLGLPAHQAADLVAGDVTQAEARGVRQAVRAKYDETQWLTLAKPLRDMLREKQRAALVAYLIPRLKLPHNVRDANDLYAHFLIDVEMDPCMMTSRLKQALSAVQLFVQRCLMNLEPQVAASAAVDVKWREWRWMKGYRVWEANRKIFLYAENWIEPELRDDKSPFFVELESELLQSDLTLETAEAAFLHYLEKLDQVARLEVVGIYHQLETENGQADGNTSVDVLHVFARTPSTPHVYFYRQRVDSAYWTAWERLDLDIEGDHFIPVMWNRRLYLFWPIFTEKASPLGLTMPNVGETFNTEPQKYWEIKLAWSERKQDKWTNKLVSSQYVTGYFDRVDDKANFFFRTRQGSQNNLYVFVLYQGLRFDVTSGRRAQAFRFDGCHSEPTTVETYYGNVENVTGTTHFHMFLREAGDRMLYLPAPTDTAALAKTPDTFLILPYASGSSLARYPFFYLDRQRTFFVIPSELQIPVWTLPEVGQADPGFVIDLVDHYWEEVLPIADPGGPMANPEDPWVYATSFPVMPEARADGGQPGGDVILTSDTGGNVMIGTRRGAAPFAAAAGSLTAAMASDASRSMTMNTVGATRSSFFLSQETAASFGWYSYRTEQGFLFQTFYHPYVCAFVRELNRHGVDGLLQRPVQTDPHGFAPRAPNAQPLPPLDFKTEYEPHTVSNPIVFEPYPVEDVDFNEDSAYAIYNWELFFHAPLLIADRLSKNQRYEEAQKWLHYIFDPTDTSSLATPQRYWRTKPFHERTREGYQRQRLQYILKLLAAGSTPQTKAQLSPEEKADLERFETSVARWRKDPFKPHLIARMRTTTYQKTVVMKYLDNLIAWADQLFRRDTIESINEATQIYILAAEILGRRPEDIPPRATPRVQTYNSLEPNLGAFSNALVQIEEFISPSVNGSVAVGSSQQPALTLPAMLYFCVPKNDKLLDYWDRVADRLFKLRHCMNIEGVVRQLPLFEPPIEPGLLVRAAAAGVDFGSVLNDLSAAQPHYRFNVLAQKASELCAELKSLGQAMLAALEKRDAERLSLLRAEQEASLLALVEEVRKLQYDEAEQNKTALSQSRQTAVTRYVHYQKLLGVQSPQVPGIGQPIPESPPSPHIAIQEEGGIKMISFEKGEMDKLKESDDSQDTAAWLEFGASIAHIVPNFNIEPFGVGATFGGSNVGSALSAVANRLRADATEASFEAGKSARLGQFAMRAHEWLLQSNLAGREIMQLDQQILAAELRMQIADRELSNHRRQLAQARELEGFLRDKYTNQELYGWMIGQLATVFFQTYQLAYDLAKRAERAFRHELGLKDSSFIQFGYWDSLKKGLLAGERLLHDLKRMEVAYLDQHKREYEITKHASLAQLDPLALVQLRQTGACVVRLPEALFDLDYPGHYMRRLKSVSLTIPAVTGPYTGVNCTLTLLKSSVRHTNTLLGGQYARQEGDTRFTDSLGAIQSIVTSSGQNDSGLFETNLRDERYLPFEGAGAMSEWQIELPAGFRQFDYDTISDVILHVRYTAREGGGLFKQQAALELQNAVNEFIRSEGQQGFVQMFSLRHEFPTAWHRFLTLPADAAGNQTFMLALDLERFPFLFHHRTLTINTIELFVKVQEEFAGTHNESALKMTLAAGTAAPTSDTAQPADLLPLATWNGLLRTAKGFNHPPGTFTLNAWRDGGARLDPAALENLVLLCHYAIT